MADFWKQTSEMFSSLFEKPKMSQKLLEKPPFKYIFDIVIETTKVTGFAKGLYVDSELDGDSYKEKEKKINFLQKLIDLTQLANKEEIAAKPQKIVAGLEPELTNLLLQGFYRAAVSGKSSDPLVKKILGGSEPEPRKEEKKVTKGPPPQPEKPKVEERPKVEEKPKPKEDAPRPAEIKQKPIEKVQEQKQQAQPPQQEGNVNYKRPSTAKKRPPQLPQNQVVAEQGQKKTGTANVILERKGNEDEDDGIVTVQPQNKITTDINSQEYSKFVRDQMKKNEVAPEEKQDKEEKQEGIRMKRIGQNANNKKDTIKNQVSQHLGTSQVPDTVVMQKLIQSICQNANPLGKQIEFIQDDIESMNYELQQWRKIYNGSKQKMVEMSRATEEAQQPLFDKIAEVEEGMKEKKTKIQHLKAQIIKNKMQIDQLLKAVLVQK